MSAPKENLPGTDSSGPKQISFRRRLAYAAVIYFSFLDLFVVTSQQKAQVADAKHSGIFEGDPLLLWRLKPNLDHAVWDYTVLSTNAQHLRSEESDKTLASKTPGTIRIVCLGDSVTFGFRVPVVWPDKPTEYDPNWLPYPMLLEKELRAANPGRTIEVITMAVPGYTSHQGLAWLRRDIDSLQPDLLTISFGWNDASFSDVPDRDAIRTNTSAVGVHWLVDHSQAFAHATRWLRSKESIKPDSRLRTGPRVSQHEYVDNMLAMVQLARTRSIETIVIAAPYRDVVATSPEGALIQPYRAALRTAMEQQRVRFLEILELTEKAYPANEGWFGERIHPNHMGHRLIASELLNLLNSTGGLQDLKLPALAP
jgi:lysophospholipase L1-like esterase